MSQKVDSVYICPWSLRDPLCESQSLAYLRQLVKTGSSFALMTFETERYAVKRSEIEAVKERLRNEGLEWYPVKWDGGTSLGSKMSGILRVLGIGTAICLRHRPRLIHSRSSLPAFMAVFLKKLFRIKYLYDADSLLSEEYADTGHLSRKSRGFRFLAYGEKIARRNADQIIVLTKKLKADYENVFCVHAPVEVIPCCVDMRRFEDIGQFRDARRAELWLQDEPLFIYVGKAGSWYLIEETFELFRVALSNDPKSRLVIISPDDPATFQRIAEAKDIQNDVYSIRSVRFADVPSWLAAADFAIALIKPAPSKRGSSPVKVSEYLAAGLPVILNLNIGDLEELIEQNRVGAVVELNPNAYLDGLVRIKSLDDVAERCRETARREFDLEDVGGVRYRSIYSKLIGPE